MSEADALLGSDRSEDLTGDQVLDFFTGAAGDEQIATRLLEPGTHLLQGSRGTGKTMLLRVAYERLRREGRGTLPVFVRFSRYLATYNNATLPIPGYSPFRNWVFAKLLAGMRDSISGLKLTPKGAAEPFGSVPLDKYIALLETHYQDANVADPSKNAAALGVPAQDLLDFARVDKVQERLLSVLDHYGLGSVFLFLDEAAQSFAEELQPDFFQIVKHLRHYRIGIKAAVYPHTTNYGADFDVGQDAIVLPIERQIESAEGMAFFSDFIQKRYGSTTLGEALGRSDAQTKFLIKMSGGNPRWFIHLLNSLNHKSADAIPSADVVAAAKELPDSTLWPYLKGLRARIKSKRRFFDTALQLAQVFIEGLRDINKSLRRDSTERSVCYVAISSHKTVPFRVHGALRLLQYAGIIYSRGPAKITARENAERFFLHPAIQLKDNTLFGSESNPPLDMVVAALTDPPRDRFKEYTRNSPRLLEFRRDEEQDALVCDNCGASLPNESRYCFRCGQPVAQVSPFEELLNAASSELELTPGIKSRLVESGRFPTVGRILDATDTQLDSIPQIGPERIKLIRYAAEEFLSG